MQNWRSTSHDRITRSIDGTLGLAFGFSLPWVLREDAGAAPVESIVLDVLVRIFADNRLEIAIVKPGMDQGVSTPMAMLIAEGLDADRSQVEVKMEGELGAYVDPKAGFAEAFGSTSTRLNDLRFRKVGAAIRHVLLQAAADRTGIRASELNTDASWIIDADGKRLLSFGELVKDAANLSLPNDPVLKTPEQLKLIGQRQPKNAANLKAAGQAFYGLDVRLPGMKYAALRQHKVFGATLLNFAELKREMPTDYQLIEVPGAMIVIGASYWQAQKYLDGLTPQYATTASRDANPQASIEQKLQAAVQNLAGSTVAKRGDGIGALDLCDSVIEAEYFAPFLAHGAMEPLKCTAWVEGDRCEFWVPTHSPLQVAHAVAQAINRAPDQIKVNVSSLGGGFGRKAETDSVVQAALASQAVQGPVQLIWSRSEDRQHDLYRPAFQAKLKAGFGAGALRVWTGKSAGPSIARQNNPATKIDYASIDGFANVPYAIDHQEIFHQEVDLGIPVSYWRSVGKSQNCFFVESFVDEIADYLQMDPLQLRRNLLSQDARAQRVLDKLAEVCHWVDHPAPSSMGMAYSVGFGSLAAMAAQISLTNNKIKVEKLWTVVDCGQAMNPAVAEAQIQGAAIYGLAAALLGKVTIRGGKVEQTLFADRPFVKLGEVPVHEVHFLTSAAPLGGLGEVATPLAAPAVANALFRLKKKRCRRLPFSDYSWT